MRFVMTLESEQPEFEIPLQYNEWVQAALYRLLPSDFGEFLHDQGFSYEKRVFRLFTFSRLLGTYRMNRETGKMTFRGPVKLVVASPLSPFGEAAINGLIREQMIRIGPVFLRVTGVETAVNRVNEREIVVRTLSPVTVYSTFYQGDGRKYTVYFHPREKRFEEQVGENLRKKYEVLTGRHKAADFRIQVIGRTRKHVVFYKNTAVQGYSATFRLYGDPEMLQVALDAGLGAKNSQGFGCLERIM